MKKLPIHLRKNGFDYEQIKRGTKACIYKQIIPGAPHQYEVFRIKVKKARIVKGNEIPAKEWFPHDEAFGVWAWSIQNLELAYAVFEWIEKGLTAAEITTIKHQWYKEYSNRT